ncbi:MULTISPECIES: hypothetical protein [Prochlorococcus]|uniref:hypothetical protein n=1 Tax=Prochlorococcus TaxID=1218 RepID=UPI000561B91C|nr:MULTISPECIES: hypothetical protein [Prochlorococcus]
MDNPVVQILLLIVGLTGTILFFWFLFSSSSKSSKSFTAIDGTKFSSESKCDAYNLLLNRLDFLYNDEILGKVKGKKEINSIKLSFINLLTKDGFSDVQLLIKYKEEFFKLVELFQAKE